MSFFCFFVDEIMPFVDNFVKYFQTAFSKTKQKKPNKKLMKVNYNSWMNSKKAGFPKTAGDFQDRTLFKSCSNSCSLWLFHLVVLLTAFWPSNSVWAQASNYVFSQSSATYTPLASPTQVHAAGWDDLVAAVPIPFTFRYNGVLYAAANVNSNGYVTFGTTVSTVDNFVPIAATELYAGAVAGFARDLISGGSTISRGTQGVSPNRVFVIQWTNAKRYNFGVLADDVINFQVRLYETSNAVEIRYGTCTATSTANIPVQAGLRGAANTDFKTRINTTSWATTSAGPTNASTLNTSSTNMPTSGLTLTWTPAAACSGAPVAGAVSPASGVACPGVAPSSITVTGQTAGVSGLSYLWQESDDNGVADTWAPVVGGTGANTLIYQPPVLTATKYYRLRMICSTAAFSASGVITYGECNPAPACTTNTAPANLATNISLTPTLSWSAAAAATNYDVYLGTTSGPTTLLANTTATSYTLTSGQALTDLTQYFWYVVPKNDNGSATCGAQNQTSFTTLNSCIAPTAAATSVVTSTTATVSWTAASPAPTNGYQYEIRTSGAAGSGAAGLQTSGSTVAGDTNDNIAGLSSQTVYTLYVRSACSGTSFSAWSAGHVFTTNCTSTNVPYSENFESAPVPFMPICTSIQNAGTGVDWVISSNPGNGFTSKTLQYSWDNDQPANAWFYTRAINLVAGVAYKISYRYGNNSALTERLKVAYGSSPIASSMSFPLADYPAINDGVPHDAAIAFIPVTSGTYYFGFNAYSAAGQFNLYVDDISVVISEPIISNFTPSAVCANWTNAQRTVVITGANFTSITGVTFNGVNAQSYVVNSTTQITAVVNAASATGNIGITNVNGTGLSATAFTIYETPVVNDITAPENAVNVCLSSTLALSNTTPGGVWNSSNTNAATIDASGTVTPILLGNTTISYTVTNEGGCVVVKTYALTISEPVVIANSTPTQTVNAGSDTTFVVAATGEGNPNLSYQWEICTDGSGTNFTPVTNDNGFSGANTNTLSITDVPLLYDGYAFRCVVTGICSAATSEVATLFVGETTISTNPEDVILCESGTGTASFSVVASEDVTTYQWQKDLGSNNWADLAEGGIYSGTNSATLSLSGLSLTDNGSRFRVQVSGLGNAISEIATLTIMQSATIDVNPIAETVCYNGGATIFNVVATGATSYQWQYASDNTNWSDVTNNIPAGVTYSNETSSALTVNTTNATPVAGTYFYRAIVGAASPCTDVTSASAQLTILGAVETASITPEQIVLAGSTVSFSVTATGSVNGYQWQICTDGSGVNFTNVLNGNGFSGATTATLSLTNVLLSYDGYQFRCVVTGACNSATSDLTTLFVGETTVNNPNDVTICNSGSGTASFSVVASTDVTAYQWQVDQGGNNWVNLVNDAMHSGANTAALSVSGITLANSGWKYRVEATGLGIVLSNAAVLTVIEAINVDNHPVSATACFNNGVTVFNVGVSGAATAYQWQFSPDNTNWNTVSNNTPSGTTYSGTNTASLTVNTTSATPVAGNYFYRAIVSAAAPCASSTSDSAQLTLIEGVAISAITAEQTVAAGANASFSITVTGTVTAFQWQVCTDGSGVNFTNVSNGNGFSGATTATLLLANAPLDYDGYQFRCVVNGNCNSVTSDATTLFVGETTIAVGPEDATICDSGAGTASFNVTASEDVTTYQWQTDQGTNNWVDLTNSAMHGGVNTNTLSVSGITLANNGWKYRAEVGGLGVAISNAATLNVIQSVAITTNPSSDFTCYTGGSATFNVGSTGGVAYQWQYSSNGINWNDVADNSPAGATYSSENGATLTVNTTIATPASGTYFYRAVVNAAAPCASAISGAAQLTISTSESTTWYVDNDGDGFGNSALPTQVSCSQPIGYTAVGGDCDDTTAAINPNQSEIYYNGVDDNCDGNIDEGSQITTKLLAGSCGATLTAIGGLVQIETIAPGTNYTGWRIRATNGAQVQVIEKNVPHFTMPEFASFAYATTYTIEIELQRNGIWLGYYGSPCQLTTPTFTQTGGAGTINQAQCGITLAQINTPVATPSLQGVTGYRFRLTNLTDPNGPNAVQVIDRAQNWFTMQMLARYNYGTTYKVEVAVKSTGGYGPYGAPCEVSSPASPSLITCGGTAITLASFVKAYSVAGATQYRFEVVRLSDNTATILDRVANYFTFNLIPTEAFTAGTAYAIRVAVMSTGTWSPYSSVCQVVSPGSASKMASEKTTPSDDAIAFKAVAFPNPFTTDFNIGVTTSSQEQIQLKVYDMLGKLVDSKEIEVSDLNLEKIGTQYPSGVYNIIVSQDGIVKTLRVIKR